ncbi:MAG TPA: GatB/YqeY domain-containing protein [Verrucomicrobiae bacterium]|nr:GatB/YqeY domain-containing protein [Verrucomicrobiae bacterium]
MSLQEKLQAELKAAMLARDPERLSTLRLLKSALGYTLIERKSEQLSDADMIVLVQREVKKRRDSAEQFQQGGRTELADKEIREIAVLETFLPAALSAAELESLVEQTIQEIGASSKKEMGAVIKAVQAKAAGRADGKSISAAVSKRLP